MFDIKSLKTLEYDKILEELASHAQSQGGKVKARNLTPFEDYEGLPAFLHFLLHLLLLHKISYRFLL